jgi:hypothetical protein
MLAGLKAIEKEVFQMKSVKFVRGLLAIMLLMAVGILAGCGDNEQTQSKPAAVSKEDVKKQAKEPNIQ